ncbi:hypothetical protein AG1IA_06677 [Rhizoctonia solani AG-1 IA]|uniref:Uncharacterized protein n=1 Tax=Thanatephorus cucumeris (strain AG1-IA) TaxID=983506 RepID=L8WMD7_THACA|nr:hypothetical protein AG1IA_06677 [Rhizoctonia solani AG-1 IA]
MDKVLRNFCRHRLALGSLLPFPFLKALVRNQSPELCHHEPPVALLAHSTPSGHGLYLAAQMSLRRLGHSCHLNFERTRAIDGTRHLSSLHCDS